MKKHALYLLALLSLLLLAALPAVAQDKIEYGQVVNGTLSNDAYEFKYTFSGAAEDVAVIVMDETDILDHLDNPALRLLGPDDTVLAEDYGFSHVALHVLLPDDGIYTIVATRRDGPDGTSVGQYTLSLVLPQELRLGQAVSAEISNPGPAHYYVYRGDSDFILTYSRKSGEMHPEITINTLGRDDGGLDEVAILSGESMTVGAVGVVPGGRVYLIQLDHMLFDISRSLKVSDYDLQLIPEDQYRG